MLVTVPLHKELSGVKVSDPDKIFSCLSTYYDKEPFIKVSTYKEMDLRSGKFLDPQDVNNTNMLELIVCGEEETNTCLIARLDNLGKGASGAAVQLLNVMIGAEETKSLL
jgi:N-acetyl-gamma-glutamyl-phosphate reductase